MHRNNLLLGQLICEVQTDTQRETPSVERALIFGGSYHADTPRPEGGPDLLKPLVMIGDKLGPSAMPDSVIVSFGVLRHPMFNDEGNSGLKD